MTKPMRRGAQHVTRATPDECAAREAEGAEVQARREALGMSRRALARALDVRPDTVQRWEEGLAPIPAARREQIAALLSARAA